VFGKLQKAVFLDEAIEEQKKWSDKNENGPPVNLAAGNAAEVPEKSARQQFEACFLTKSGALPDRRMADDFIAHGANFIVHPDGNFFAAIPEEGCSVDKKEVTNNGKNAYRGTGTPKHGASPRVKVKHQV
jgi:hypothetical protein